MNLDDLVTRLRALDSCSISDACDQLGLTGRVMTTSRPLTGPDRIAGRVITVELGAPTGDRTARHLCAAATDSATSDDVIVVAHQGRTDCAGWGGNLSRAAKHRGAAGTIVDGAVRDVDEAIEIRYPVFAGSATPLTARGRTQEHSWGQAVEIAGIDVDQGDYVLGDSTGVVFIAASDIDRVLATAEVIAAKEAAMAQRIEGGEPVSKVMGANYEKMLELP